MRLIIRFMALLVCTASLRGFGQGTNNAVARFQAVFHQIQTKIAAGKTNQADLKAEIAGYDQAIAEETGVSAEAAAEMVYMKAMLYVQVFGDFDKGEQILKQLKTDFPGTDPGKQADDIIASVEKAAEVKRIQDQLAVGTPFPDFVEEDLNGKPISVGNFKGKVVLVDFWATWCPLCLVELPNVIATYKKYHANGFEIIGVSLDDDRGTLKTFLKRTDGMIWPEYFDGQHWNNTLAVRYGIDGIPNNILVGPDGRIIGKSLRGEDLQTAVAMALKQKQRGG